MKSRTVDLAVGIFVILFAVALFLLAMRVSGLAGSSFGKSTYELTAKIDNISGLKERAKVTISGVKVGQVKSIQLDPMSHKAVVTVAMDKDLTTFTPKELKEVEANALEDLKYSYEYEQADAAQQKAMQKQLFDNMKNITTIDDDAYIKVATNGIIGEKYLKIEPGGAFTYIHQGGSFPDTQTQGTMEIEDLVNKFITSGSTNQQNTTQATPSEPEKTVQSTSSKQDDVSFISE